jgi:hypothetical protein
MNKLPAPFWAVLLASFGVGLAVICLASNRPENVVLQVLTIASNLVSGALGAFAGHAMATAKVDATTTDGAVTINTSK